MRKDAVIMNVELVEKRRIELGLTLQDVARRAGISDVTLRHARHGKSISSRSLHAIARAIRCPWRDCVSSFVALADQASVPAALSA